MKFTKMGAFWMPAGYVIDDVGGKAKPLIEHEQIIRECGFSLPNAVVLPWTLFPNFYKDNGLDPTKITDSRV